MKTLIIDTIDELALEINGKKVIEKALVKTTIKMHGTYEYKMQIVTVHGGRYEIESSAISKVSDHYGPLMKFLEKKAADRLLKCIKDGKLKPISTKNLGLYSLKEELINLEEKISNEFINRSNLFNCFWRCKVGVN